VTQPDSDEDFYFLAVMNGHPDTNSPTLQGAMDYVETLVNPSGTILLVGYAAGDKPIVKYLNGQVTDLTE
jgi:hypothetical protein